jgi:hypothetical protein
MDSGLCETFTASPAELRGLPTDSSNYPDDRSNMFNLGRSPEGLTYLT